MHRIGIAAALVAAVAASTCAAQADAGEAARAALASVVSVLPQWPGRAPDAGEPEGSGVVIADGHWIVTAAHVLGGATRVLVRNADGTVIAATPGPVSDAVDLALLRIDTPMPPLEWAAEEPALAAPVCALGNAFGLGQTIACGVVSATRRSGVGFNAIEDFVQTDAAVNPGMSGGALVDADGRLAGVLSAIFTKQSEASIGVNFAVSARLARLVTQQLIETGAFKPASSGMTLKPAPARGETGQAAAQVVAIVADGAAGLAGLRVGDRILGAGDRRIRGPADMRAALALGAAGGELALRVLRDGQEIELTLQPR